MLRIVRALLLGVLLFTFVALPVRQAAAHSASPAGDPIFNKQGTTARQKGMFSAYFQVQGSKKKGGHPPGEEGHGDDEGHHGDEGHDDAEAHHSDEHAESDARHAGEAFEESDSKRLDLFLSWTPLDRVTLTLDLPWVLNGIKEFEDGERHDTSLSGFGDMALAVSGVLWRNSDALPSTWVEGRTLVKFPTGKSRQKVDGVRDPHLQAGTGSWDFGFGLAAVHRFERVSLYSSVYYRINTEGSLDYEYGDFVLANAALQLPLGRTFGLRVLNAFTLGFELNYRWADFDEFKGARFDDSGGSILYLTPSLRVQLPWRWEGSGLALRASVQIPATNSWLNGFQEEQPTWLFGIQYGF